MKAEPAPESAQEDLLVTMKVAIIGLGLMGGSLALALKGHCGQLLGFDVDAETAHMAQANQVVEYASVQMDEILPQANLVILAAPVRQILSLLGQLDSLHPGPAVVMDLGSTKRLVMQAMQALPERFDPLGGHPICGKEKSSLANAEASLYQGTRFVLCRLPRTTDRAINIATQLVGRIGAIPLWMEAESHDRRMAATSHLSYLLANALVQATPQEAAELVGPGYRSTTRLAASYAPMLIDVLDTNQDMVLMALANFRQALDQLEADLRTEDPARMVEFLQRCAQRHALLTSDQILRTEPGNKEER